MDYKQLLAGLLDKIAGFREERASAGWKYRALGLIAEMTETIQLLETDVLARVRREAVLDIDNDFCFDEIAEQAMRLEIAAPKDGVCQEQTAKAPYPQTDFAEGQADTLSQCAKVLATAKVLQSHELTRVANDALSLLVNILKEIEEAMDHPKKSDAYQRLYYEEQKSFNATRTAAHARKNFKKWKEDSCYGNISLEDLEEYRLEKLLSMFEKIRFANREVKIKRGKGFPGEIDFSRAENEEEACRHYTVFRKMVGYEDGFLIPNPVRIGQYFYAHRKDPNAKQHRTTYFKYMLKIELAEQERRRLIEEAEEGEAVQEAEQTGFRMLVTKPEVTDKLLARLHELMECKQSPKEVVKPIRAAMEAGIISRPTWEHFCQEFGEDRVKSKSSLSSYTNPEIQPYQDQAFITMVAEFKKMIS